VYIPEHFDADSETVAGLLRRPGAAELVSMTPDGLVATTLPLWFESAIGEHGALLGHVARRNPHWRATIVGESLAIIRRPDAYISPSWYAAKAEHGRVVPTWDYVVIHAHGTLVVHDDPAWTAENVRRLTELHEGQREHPWSVDDAPAEYVAAQLRAIVGLELVLSRIEAKAKLSQNRSAADIDGVIAGLTALGDEETADAIRRARPHSPG
jgi:transcriptional regulator